MKKAKEAGLLAHAFECYARSVNMLVMLRKKAPMKQLMETGVMEEAVKEQQGMVEAESEALVSGSGPTKYVRLCVCVCVCVCVCAYHNICIYTNLWDFIWPWSAART